MWYTSNLLAFNSLCQKRAKYPILPMRQYLTIPKRALETLAFTLIFGFTPILSLMPYIYLYPQEAVCPYDYL